MKCAVVTLRVCALSIGLLASADALRSRHLAAGDAAALESFLAAAARLAADAQAADAERINAQLPQGRYEVLSVLADNMAATAT